jgi:hypothetical protein
MDWFEKLTGFRETRYEETRACLEVEGGRLLSRINGASYGIGELELVSLQTLRERAKSAGNLPGRVKTSVVTGDVRRMHRSPENAGALFQVASQFNLLEMVSPDVTPEHGVTDIKAIPLRGRLAPSLQARRPSTVITSFPSTAAKVRPRRGNSMGSPTLARL